MNIEEFTNTEFYERYSRYRLLISIPRAVRLMSGTGSNLDILQEIQAAVADAVETGNLKIAEAVKLDREILTTKMLFASEGKLQEKVLGL